jgi:hypothetical protein
MSHIFIEKCWLPATFADARQAECQMLAWIKDNLVDLESDTRYRLTSWNSTSISNLTFTCFRSPLLLPLSLPLPQLQVRELILVRTQRRGNPEEWPPVRPGLLARPLVLCVCRLREERNWLHGSLAATRGRAD